MTPDGVQREMTLDEWAERLPPGHLARRELASLRKRLEAADLTIGTLQADRIKAQATIDHYRTMLEAAKEVALAIGDRTHGAMASECNEWRERLEQAALAGEEKWVPHVIEEGSRKHVIWWNSDGAHCSEPMCEWNKPALAGEKKP